MPKSINRDQLKQTIAAMVSQSELFPESIDQQVEDLNDEDLEKLTITLHIALQAEKKLTAQQQERLQNTVLEYFDGKQRIYQKAQGAWLAQTEARHEAQECLFEESLLAQL